VLLFVLICRALSPDFDFGAVCLRRSSPGWTPELMGCVPRRQSTAGPPPS